MATRTTAVERHGAYRWLTGVAGGLLAAVVTGLVIYLVLDPAIIARGVPEALGLSGVAVGWLVYLAIGVVTGLLYAGVATIDRVAAYASRPNTGAVTGIVFGLFFWLVSAVVIALGIGQGSFEPGAYPVTLRTVLNFLLYGLVIGLVYGVSPYTE